MPTPLKMAVDFSGLEVKKFHVQENFEKEEPNGDLERVIAIVINARSLPSLSLYKLSHSLPRKAPILVYGVNPETDRSKLDEWSRGKILGADLSQRPSFLAFHYGLTAVCRGTFWNKKSH